MLGQYENDGSLRFTDKVGTGFDYDQLKHIHQLMRERSREQSPFRRPTADEPALPRGAHFCEPELVCEVRFADWTSQGGIRHPSFLRMVPDADPRASLYGGPQGEDSAAAPGTSSLAEPGGAIEQAAAIADGAPRRVALTNPDKVFWPAQGYTKGRSGQILHFDQRNSKWGANHSFLNG